jgi:transcriptional regulator with XRE-family HTH domain
MSALVSRDLQDEERQRRFARNLRAARERASLTQAGMAEKMGMGDEVYARYERAKMWPSLDKLCRLCEILDCTADELLGLDEVVPVPVAPPPPEDPQPVRRLMRQLRKARARTVRLVGRMLNEIEAYARAEDDDAGAERGEAARLAKGAGSSKGARPARRGKTPRNAAVVVSPEGAAGAAAADARHVDDAGDTTGDGAPVAPDRPEHAPDDEQ